jgi:hypothetical protein
VRACLSACIRAVVVDVHDDDDDNNNNNNNDNDNCNNKNNNKLQRILTGPSRLSHSSRSIFEIYHYVT